MKTIKHRLSTRTRHVLKGIFSTFPDYEERNPSGDWEAYYGKPFYQVLDFVDLNICWSAASTGVMETQLQFLRDTGKMSSTTIQWFRDNGYIDADNDFYLSHAFIPTISGVGRNGNDEAEHWRLASKYGMIPNKMLDSDVLGNYFDKTKITSDMYAMGKEFLKRIKIDYRELGKRFTSRPYEMIAVAQKMCPLQMGVPVCYPWNQEQVEWCGETEAGHSVEMRKVDEVGKTYPIFDTYRLVNKVLGAGYYIPIITQGLLTPTGYVPVKPTVKSPLQTLIDYAISVFFGFGSFDPQIKPS